MIGIFKEDFDHQTYYTDSINNDHRTITSFIMYINTLNLDVYNIKNETLQVKLESINTTDLRDISRIFKEIKDKNNKYYFLISILLTENQLTSVRELIINNFNLESLLTLFKLYKDTLIYYNPTGKVRYRRQFCLAIKHIIENCSVKELESHRTNSLIKDLIIYSRCNVSGNKSKNNLVKEILDYKILT